MSKKATRSIPVAAITVLAAGMHAGWGQVHKAPSSRHAAARDFSLGNSELQILYKAASGTMDIRWRDGSQLAGVGSAVTLADGRTLSTDLYSDHRLEGPPDSAAPSGPREYTIHNTGRGLPELMQHIWLTPRRPTLSVQAELDGEASRIGTRHFDAVVVRRESPVLLPGSSDLRVLHVPFDNDMWFRFASVPVGSNESKTIAGEEVTAIYDNATRHGIVLGSITHETWKTAIEVHSARSQIGSIDVYGGISDPNGVRSDTHDALPHGVVRGDKVVSPRVFIGAFADWRDGLDAYADANAEIQPPLKWHGGIPAGWNSWAAYGGKINYQRYLGAAEYVRDTLVPEGFGNGRTIYVNLDAFWSRLDAPQLVDAVANIKAMSSAKGVSFEPGIYWTPFAYWSDDLDAFVEGTGMRYRYRDILLKGPDGKFLPKFDGGLAIDPSHPGTKARTAFFMKEFGRLGFTYLKLDFLSHGALEGAHYDPAIQTGIEAYNLGMKQVVAEAGDQTFLSLSIAPLFPSGYGHARRLACDTKGHINGKEQSTEYMLNALTYGWWTNKRLYILDPDHVVLGEHGDLGARSVDEGNSRLLSAIIGGGMVLDSSPLSEDPQARELAKSVYAKPDWFDLSASGEAFRPIEGDTGSAATNAFVRSDGGNLYLAVFNYDDKNPATIRVPIARIASPATGRTIIKAIDTVSGTHESFASGAISVTLRPAESKLLLLKSDQQP